MTHLAVNYVLIIPKNIFKYRQNVLAKLSHYLDCKQKTLNWYLSCISEAVFVGKF